MSSHTQGANVTFQVSNMQGQKRAGILKENLEKYVGGVQEVNIDVQNETVNVTYDPGRTDVYNLEAVLKNLDFYIENVEENGMTKAR